MLYNRSVHTIFAPSGLPVPSTEEVRIEADELVQRNGWGVPLILALKKINNPYWREAITHILLNTWKQMVADKDEQTFYLDGDGNGIFCWMEAESDMNRVIRRSTGEQVEWEQNQQQPLQTVTPNDLPAKVMPVQAVPVNNYYIHIENNQAPIYSHSNVTIH